MRVSLGSSVFLVLLLSPVCFGQLPSSRCDSTAGALKDCKYFTQFETAREQIFSSEGNPFDHAAVGSGSSTDGPSDSAGTTIAPEPAKQEGFHWGRALTESFTFLIIEQAYVVHTDFNWVVSENGIPFNHYWRDYNQSLTTWWHAGWSAGENPLYNYVGHPIQGALTSYIQIQNDPKSAPLEFANTKANWKSRLKATPWNANGSYPCDTKTCYWGVGKVNLVMTPVGGFGWMLAEEAMDKKITEQLVESHTQNRLLIDAVRSSLNPIRGGANILHGKRPWYRPRDLQVPSLFIAQKNAVSGAEPPKTAPSHGDVFLGYIHLGESNCQAIFSGSGIACDPLSARASSLSGWNLALEKKYFRYFGAVADFSRLYGSASQSNFLFGIRGGASIGRFRPFAQVLFGAVHARENGTAVPKSDTTFAEDLGLGIDFRLMRLLSWRFQTDELKTGSPTFERYNVRLSSGVAVRF